VLPERAGDGARTEATAVKVRGAAADITGVATAVGVMAHGAGGAIIIEWVSRRPNCPHCHRPPIEIDHYGQRLIGNVKCNRWVALGNYGPGGDQSEAHLVVPMALARAGPNALPTQRTKKGPIIH
jgi:hypothetical protein